MKKYIALFATLAAAVSADARIFMLGTLPEYGLKDISESQWYEINPHTWDTFTSFDDEIIFGTNEPRNTLLQIEFYSTGVHEGRKIGGETLAVSFQDRGAFFGGEGYMDFLYYAPVNPSKYAQQAMFLGGWKYNLTKHLALDLGGNVIYSTKKVIGPGIAGYGGNTWRGDFYVGFVGDIKWLSPFVYFDYDSGYDAKKYLAGFAPKWDISEAFAIKGLSLEPQITFGYVSACRFAGNQKIAGGYWRNDYAYIQGEVNLVYTINNKWKTFIGVGWACHNDGKGKVGKGGVDMGPDQMVWGSCGIGYIF